jgi:predicted RNA-binding protein with PIN domain
VPGSSLVVDAANVMGSRPDGWWRDRAGAAARLVAQLASADVPHDELVVVLEGAARAGVPSGRDGALVTVHAAGSGDDTIVAEAEARVRDGRQVAVVTADRALQARVEAAGATVVRPSWLLERLAP